MRSRPSVIFVNLCLEKSSNFYFTKYNGRLQLLFGPSLIVGPKIAYVLDWFWMKTQLNEVRVERSYNNFKEKGETIKLWQPSKKCFGENYFLENWNIFPWRNLLPSNHWETSFFRIFFLSSVCSIYYLNSIWNENCKVSAVKSIDKYMVKSLLFSVIVGIYECLGF